MSDRCEYSRDGRHLPISGGFCIACLQPVPMEDAEELA